MNINSETLKKKTSEILLTLLFKLYLIKSLINK